MASRKALVAAGEGSDRVVRLLLAELIELVSGTTARLAQGGVDLRFASVVGEPCERALGAKVLRLILTARSRERAPEFEGIKR